MTHLESQCEFIHPSNPNQSQLCRNRASYWVRRGEAEILVCGQHLISTIKDFALPIPPSDTWWGPNSLITVAVLTTSPDGPPTSYPRPSASYRALREAGKA